MNEDLVTIGDIARRITKPGGGGGHYSRQWVWSLTCKPGFPEPAQVLPAGQGRPREIKLWAWPAVDHWFADYIKQESARG